jgi:hypothetical protein
MQLLTDDDCTRIYNEANGITTKNPPLSTERIFKAMRQAYAQGYAQGAAAQLAEKPSAWKWRANQFHDRLEAYCPPGDAYDEGTLKPLYTRREAK